MSVWRLLRNPAYASITIAGCFSAFVISGMFPFLPKYIENAFRLHSSTANYLTGMKVEMFITIVRANSVAYITKNCLNTLRFTLLIA